MGWVDVAIPGLIGLLVIVAPQWFSKLSGDATQDARRASHLRYGGLLLIGVAGLYCVIKFAS